MQHYEAKTLHKNKTRNNLTSRKTSIQNVIQIFKKLHDNPLKAKQQQVTESSLTPGNTRHSF
jgi:hypothetical protein